MLPAHSKVGASSMSRWVACPGSVAASANLQDVTSVYAAEGTVAHDIAAKCLAQNAPPLKHAIGESVLCDGHTIGVTQEMLEAVQVYFDYVTRQQNSTTLRIEQRFHLKTIHPDAFGTADAVVYDPSSQHLEVIDYKHGSGVPVEVTDNVQLMYYALGAILEQNRVRTVTMTSVQPRCPHSDGPIRSWTLGIVEFIDFAADLKAAIEATQHGNPIFKTGSHCRWCKAAAVCDTLRTQVMTDAKTEFQEDATYDPQQLSEALQHVEIVEAWAKSVREFAYREALRGRTPPDFKLVNKRNKRDWAQSDEDTVSTLELLGFDKTSFFTDPKLRTPPQMEKELKDKKSLAPLISSESTGTTLVALDDNRPAVSVGPEAEFDKI